MPNTIAYEWSQTVAHLSLWLRIPSLKADLRQRQRDRQLSVTVASCYIRVCWHPWLLEIDLWGDVAFRSAAITPGADCLTIVVPKVKEGLWGSLTVGSNPQLQQDIRERRRAALAEHAEWQEQLQQQRISAREARKQQQQKHVWRQQQEQREWHQRQKDIQVQEVLEQLQEENTLSAKSGETRDTSPLPLADDQKGEHTLQDFPEAESTKSAWSSQQGRPQPQERMEPSAATHTLRDSGRSCTRGREQKTVVGCDRRASTREINEETPSEIPAPTLGVQRGACMKQESAVDGYSTDLVASPNHDVVGAPSYAQLAVPHVQAVKPSPSVTIKVSFAARRPNKVPARGPLAPPLPQSEPDLGKQICTREKPEDLSRLQEASPSWLQSKATRLLTAGDAAAAEETYNIILEPPQRQSLHRLACVKALCGRSLARLATGENKKALADCNEAIALLQELQQQEDVAAAAAGQPLEKGPLQAELSHLHHVLLSRRAAAFLKLDALEDAAKSFEELLQLQPAQPLSTVEHLDSGDDGYLDQQRAAVTKDIQHIRRLQQMRKVKEEADRVLRLALTTQQERLSAHSPELWPKTVDPSHEEKQTHAVCATTEQGPDTDCLLQRSIRMYLNCLTILVPQAPAGSRGAGVITTPEGMGNDEWDVAQAEQGERVTTVTARLQAAVLASAANHNSFPWAGAAATVLASIALALTQLRECSLVSAADFAHTTAETLIQHAEERLKLQHINARPSVETANERREQVFNTSRCTTKPPHSAPTPGSPFSLEVLHQANQQLLRKLRQKVLSSRVVKEQRQP